MSAGRRLVRGSIAAGLSTWIALAFHLLGGGEVPAAVGVIIPFVLSWCACVTLATWRRDALRLTTSVIASQGLFHLLFTLGAAGASSGGHHGSAVHLGAADAAGGAAWSQMWLAHLVAAGITVLALHSGERALRQLARAVVAVARRLWAAPDLAATGIAVVPVARATATVDVRPSLGHFHRDISRRGPPVGSSCR